jgi:phosphate transport system substrate-binding protein
LGRRHSAVTIRAIGLQLAALGFWLIAAAAPVAAQSFTGAGSTFAHPLIGRWGQMYASLEGDVGGAVTVDGGLDYEPVGSLGGVLRAASGLVQFGATDIPLTPQELARLDLMQFPIASGGIAVATNLPGLSGGALRLSGPVIARIYLGEIRSWSHPAIRDLNDRLPLPDAPIAVFHREDGSGTTWNFAAFLGRVSPDWMQQVGVDAQLRWPVGSGARGNRDLAERVRATPNAIGFVEAGLATRMGLQVALVENAAGNFIAPVPGSLAEAAATRTLDPARHFYAPDTRAAGAAAYPITASVYVVMQRSPRFRGPARRAQDFFRAALTEGAEETAALGFVPLPPTVVRQVLAYLRNPPR